MKKVFFNPANMRKVSCRRFPVKSFITASYKSDGGKGPDDEDDDEDEDDGAKAEQKKLLKTIRGMVSKQLEGRAKKEDIQATVDAGIKEFKDMPLEALRSMADEKTGVLAKLTAQGLEIEGLKTRVSQGDGKKTLRQQVEEWQTRNKAGITSIKNGQKVELPALELSLRVVSSPMTPANSLSGSAYLPMVQFEAGLVDIPRLQPTFWDFLTKGRTNAATYGWVNKTNPQGAAGFIGPGILKPGISFALETEISNAKKIAISAKSTTELLEDIDGMATFIRDELSYQLYAKMNTTLMTGTGSSTVPVGIQSLSVAYTLSTVKTTNPTFMDCIRACVAQLRSGNIQGVITAFVNPIDSANMDLSKAIDSGVYLLPPFVTSEGRTISGCSVIEDNNVVPGNLQIGFLAYYRILIYKDFTVTTGWENDDFTKNLVTFIAEMRLHQFFNDQFTGAFIFDTFANIEAAITA